MTEPDDNTSHVILNYNKPPPHHDLEIHTTIISKLDQITHRLDEIEGLLEDLEGKLADLDIAAYNSLGDDN